MSVRVKRLLRFLLRKLGPLAYPLRKLHALLKKLKKGYQYAILPQHKIVLTKEATIFFTLLKKEIAHRRMRCK